MVFDFSLKENICFRYGQQDDDESMAALVAFMDMVRSESSGCSVSRALAPSLNAYATLPSITRPVTGEKNAQF